MIVQRKDLPAARQFWRTGELLPPCAKWDWLSDTLKAILLPLSWQIVAFCDFIFPFGQGWHEPCLSCAC